MRNITKFKRSIRAISPVISVLLMIAIAVVASLVAYAWVMGYMNFQTGKVGNSIQIPSYASGTTDNLIVVYVQNVGQGTVKISTTSSVYINDALKPVTLVDGVAPTSDQVSIGEGETRALTVDLSPDTWSAGTQIKIKVVTVEGATMEVKGTGSSSNNNQNGGQTYTLTITPPEHGSIAASPSQTVFNDGASVVLTATPDSGWAFSAWGGDASGSTSPVTITMDSNKAVTATFTEIPPEEYVLTTSAQGNGHVDRDPNEATYTSGTPVEITPVADAGWTFDHWTGDLTGNANPATIAMTGDISVTAVFTQNEYTLTVTAIGTGSVVKSPNQATYHYGDEVELTANPSDGSIFTEWTGDLTGSTNPAQITITDDTTIGATFTLDVATQLVFTAKPASVAPFSYTTVFTVERQTASGNPSTTGSIEIGLSDGTNSGYFYANSGDFDSINSVTIPDGASYANFYWAYWSNNGLPRTVTITASYTGLTSATTTVQVVNPTVVTQSPSVNGGGDWDNENRAYSNDNNRATSDQDNEQCTYSGYSFNVPSSATISQVRVRLDAFGNDNLILEVSADGGSTWLTTTHTYDLPNSDANGYFVDITSWTTWTPDSINNDMIWVRVTHDQTGGLDTINLDWIPIEVTYLP